MDKDEIIEKQNILYTNFKEQILLPLIMSDLELKNEYLVDNKINYPITISRSSFNPLPEIMFRKDFIEKFPSQYSSILYPYLELIRDVVQVYLE